MDRSVRMTLMAIVVRLGPVALLQRRAGRIEELERVIGEPVELIDVASVAELVRAMSESDPVAVVVDAAAPGVLEEVVAAAGIRPVLRPLRRRVRNSRGEVDELFDGYGLLTAGGAVVPLAGGQLGRA